MQIRVKNLRNRLDYSLLRVKARGCAFRCAAFTLCAAETRGTLLRRFCRDDAPAKGVSK